MITNCRWSTKRLTAYRLPLSDTGSEPVSWPAPGEPVAVDLLGPAWPVRGLDYPGNLRSLRLVSAGERGSPRIDGFQDWTKVQYLAGMGPAEGLGSGSNDGNQCRHMGKGQRS